MALNVPLSQAPFARAAPSFLSAFRARGAGRPCATAVVGKAAPGTMHGSFHVPSGRRGGVVDGDAAR
jgi:hypothetical protein